MIYLNTRLLTRGSLLCFSFFLFFFSLPRSLNGIYESSESTEYVKAGLLVLFLVYAV